MPLNPQLDYVSLGADGRATTLAGGDAFWQLPPAEAARHGQGWLVSEYVFVADWPTWEMHPEGDEFVYLLAGEVEMQLEEPGGLRKIAISGSGAIVVPRGVWHTAKVIVAPSRMLHVTRGGGTQVRPA